MAGILLRASSDFRPCATRQADVDFVDLFLLRAVRRVCRAGLSVLFCSAGSSRGFVATRSTTSPTLSVEWRDKWEAGVGGISDVNFRM